MEVRVLDDTLSLIDAAATLFADVVGRAVATRGRCTVALSGGSTPRALFALLASEPWASRVPWTHLHVFWGDERWVANDHPDSNYRMAQEALLQYVPVPAAHVHGMRGDYDHPTYAATAYELLLRAELAPNAGGVPAFDLLLLGMGPDGHTASLFPHTSAVGEMKRLVVVNHVDKLDTDRITITTPLIRAADATLVLIQGSEKAAVLARVLSGPLDVPALPSQLLRSGMLGPVHWLLDRAAGAQLPADLTTAQSAPTPS